MRAANQRMLSLSGPDRIEIRRAQARRAIKRTASSQWAGAGRAQSRSAATGLILAARRAGIQLAARTAATRTAAVVPRVSGS